MLSVIAIVYGALVAMVQPDMKKLVAYSSVSHMGFVVLGTAAMNLQGVQGAVYQMLAHGVSTGGLFCIVGMLSDRRHTRLISEYGGIKKIIPRLTAASLLITLASIGLPGMNGFIGEFLIMLGAFKWDPRFVVVAGLGVILSAVYMLWMFQRVFYGEVTNDHNAHMPDLSVARVGDRRPAGRRGHRHGRGAEHLPEADGTRRRPDRAAHRKAPTDVGLGASRTCRTCRHLGTETPVNRTTRRTQRDGPRP